MTVLCILYHTVIKQVKETDVMNILIADDEVHMVSILERYFEREGYRTVTAYDGQEAIDKFYTEHVNVAVLDWMMPVVDGIEVCRLIKDVSSAKVVMLTAKSESDDELKALCCGADEYVRKPFDPRVLMARIRRLVKEPMFLTLKDININLDLRKVYENGREIVLTRREYELLKCLVEHKGEVLSRNRLLSLVWGIDYDGDDRTVDTHINRLRNKLEHPEQIKTHRGLGYCIES